MVEDRLASRGLLFMLDFGEKQNHVCRREGDDADKVADITLVDDVVIPTVFGSTEASGHLKQPMDILHECVVAHFTGPNYSKGKPSALAQVREPLRDTLRAQ
eukprot:7679024-Pyramimonas_sp.AAC.1